MKIRKPRMSRRIGMTAAPLAEAKLITAKADFGPRGGAKSQAATPAQTASNFNDQADGLNTARIMQNENGDIVGAESGFGNGTKKYDSNQINWIMSRGASGGSLSRQDQAVYNRMMFLRQQKVAQEQKDAEDKKALDLAHAEDERKRKLDAAEWDRQNAIRTKQVQDAQIAEEERRNAEFDRRTKDERDYKAQQQQAKLDAENAKYEALNNKYGIAEGTRLTDKDYGDLEAGRTKWGYSQKDQEDIDSINSEVDEARKSGSFTAEELATVEEEAKKKIASFQKRILPNDKPQTAEQIYNGAFTIPKEEGGDGTRYIADGEGGLAVIPGTGPQKEVETPAEKNARVAQERKDKWLDDRIKDLLGIKEKVKDEETLETVEKPVYTYQTAYDQAMKEMGVRFPAAPSVPAQPSVAGATPPSATPPATPTNETDPRKKWAQFAD